MFDKEDQKPATLESQVVTDEKSPFHKPTRSQVINYVKLAVFVVIGVLLIVATAIVFILYQKPAQIAPIIQPVDNQNGDSGVTTSTVDTLPGELGNGQSDEFDIGDEWKDLQAEALAFGQFYEPVKDDFAPIIKQIDLPINIKADVSNYYVVSRKVSLDPYIEDINNEGFAILDNEFAGEANNFFDLYRLLLSKEVPILVTSDYIMFYYQTVYKQVFKEIEKSVFYDNVWAINKALYDIALTRYKKRLDEVGIANDPVLEGERLETSFYAVTLQLLTPTPGQINTKANFVDVRKFNEGEAMNYNFEMPESIRAEVIKEANLIREARQITKSPILLYEQNYQDYKVPVNYSLNAKLNNFYLTRKWLTSVFPLFYQGSDCPDCLLDYEDWIINLTGASLLTKDLYDNQELKNQWATIYKFVSFFTGLRAELTYLDYQEALVELFGPQYSVEKLFNNENVNREADLIRLQSELKAKAFSPIEGGLDHEEQENQTRIGMRLLQEPYWPNDYIMSELTGLDKKIIGEQEYGNKLKTVCRARGDKDYRCKGFGLDIINLLEPIQINDPYFTENINYENYMSAMNNLRRLLETFDTNAWHNNIYWVNMDIYRTLLKDNPVTWPTYANSSTYQTDYIYQTILGAWVNLHLAEDELENFYEVKGRQLGEYTECNLKNYVEPNRDLLKELIAKNEMLIKILLALNVTERTNAASIELKNLNNDLKELKRITEKELKGEVLDNEDCEFIQDFTSTLSVVTPSSKKFELRFGNQVITEDISGNNMLAAIYEQDSKKILTIGPLFKYEER